MKELMQKRMDSRGQSGFTLIELLVVIAILAVLAGVVVFAVGGITDNSQASACSIDKRTVQTAAEAYRAQKGSYAADEATLASEGFLESESTLWDYAPPAGAAVKPTYTAVAPCT